jgi:p-hydroxybenzoate 3-monooxygenase
VAARVAAGAPLEFSVSDVTLHDLEGDSPSVRYRRADGSAAHVRCDFVAGCDGHHGVSRNAIPAHERIEHSPHLSVRVVRHPGRSRRPPPKS